MALSEKKHHTSRGGWTGPGGAFETHCTAKFREHPPPSRSSSSCSRKSPAVPGHPVWVSRGGHRRRAQQCTVEQLADVVPMVQGSGHSWVAGGGGSGGGGASEARRAVCRAGHRSAHDLFGPGPSAFCHSSSAEGRTVGGSADGAGIFTGGRSLP